MNNQYTYRVEWSEEDQVHIGRCLEFPSLAAHGPNRQKALSEIEDVVAESVKWMAEAGERLPPAISTADYKGNILFRTTPKIHRALMMRAREEGISVNQLLSGLIQRNLFTQGIDNDVQELEVAVSRIRVEIESLEGRLRETAASGD